MALHSGDIIQITYPLIKEILINNHKRNPKKTMGMVFPCIFEYRYQPTKKIIFLKPVMFRYFLLKYRNLDLQEKLITKLPFV